VRRSVRRLGVGLFAGALIGVGLAAPAAAVGAPYPDTTHYTRVSDLEKYKVVDEDGIWFTTPLGLTCGIGDDGSYGCSGVLPGAPFGDNEVGWFPGDSFPRLYHADELRFNSGRSQAILIGEAYVDYRGSRCAVSSDSLVYCIHGDDPNSQLAVNSSMTWRGADAEPST